MKSAQTQGQDSASRFYFLHLVIPLIAAGLVLWVIYLLGVDERITRLFFDPVTQQFPLRNRWFLEVVMHRWAKYAVVILGVAVLAAYLVSFRIASLAPLRRVFLFLILAMGLSSGAVSYLKSVSHKQCPYDLKMYGGYAPYTGIFEKAPPGVKPGRCWPGGHSSAGFCLMAFYFVGLRLRNKRVALWGLYGGFGLGFVFGMGRVLQGAHFLSHHLWAALICWLVMLALYELMLRRLPIATREITVQT
ncbi:MAG TPA: phosphatase PAP2 family protein [Burkholderiales bacterium]|nr:phosphatase PAP2 family protein [Burkholderiales bacterium]